MTKTPTDTCPDLHPLALQDAPALIEAVFPAQKVSFEAQRERKAGAGQTLTALGSYWKGRKPLILVRAIVLGSLLPLTQDVEKDLEIFEKLMSFDDESLARRVLIQNSLKPRDIAARIELANPWDYFTYTETDQRRMRLSPYPAYENSESPPDVGRTNEWQRRMRLSPYPAYENNDSSPDVGRISEAHPASSLPGNLIFPLDTDAEGITLRWRRDIAEADKLDLIRKTLATFATYEEKAGTATTPTWASRPIPIRSWWNNWASCVTASGPVWETPFAAAGPSPLKRPGWAATFTPRT